MERRDRGDELERAHRVRQRVPLHVLDVAAGRARLLDARAVQVDAGHVRHAGAKLAGQHPLAAADVERRRRAGRHGVEHQPVVVEVVVPARGHRRIMAQVSSPPCESLVSRIVETVVPRRLGVPFRWVLASSWTTNLGDGILIAAGPLLVAARTHDAVRRRAGGDAAVAAAPALRAVRRGADRPRRPATARHRRRPPPRSRARCAGRAPSSSTTHRWGSCWSRCSSSASPRRSPTTPRRRSSRCSSRATTSALAQRPHPGRLHHGEPARRAPDRRRTVRRRAGLADRGRRRPRRRPGWC